MKIVVRARAGGKTTQLIEWLKEDQEHRTIVVHSQQYARDLAVQFGIDDSRSRPVKIISWHDFINERLNGTHRGVAIDNLDLCINWPIFPSMVSLTGESI